jgi:hypothetical protein
VPTLVIQKFYAEEIIMSTVPPPSTSSGSGYVLRPGLFLSEDLLDVIIMRTDTDIQEVINTLC